MARPVKGATHTCYEQPYNEIALTNDAVSELLLESLRARGYQIPEDAVIEYPENDFRANAYVVWTGDRKITENLTKVRGS